MKQKITIKEIASLANVSIGTVDRVLHNRGRVAKSTREKIIQIAKQGDYSSNPIARNLKLRRSFNIATLLPTDQYYFLTLKQGIEQGIEECEAFGFALLDAPFFKMQTRSIPVSGYVEQVLLGNPSALIIAAEFVKRSKGAMELLKQSNIPCVLIESALQDVDYLTILKSDPYQSGMVSGRLLDTGAPSKTDMFVLTFDEDDLSDSTVRARINGFKNYFHSKESSTRFIYDINLHAEDLSIYEFARTFLLQSEAARIFVPSSKGYSLHDILKEVKKKRSIRSLTFDLLQSNKIMLEDGTIDFILNQQPRNQGRIAVNMLYKHFILGNSISKIQPVPIDIVIRENLNGAQP